MPLYVKSFSYDSSMGYPAYEELVLRVEFQVVGPNPRGELDKLRETLIAGVPVLIFAEGEEVPCQTDQSEPWPGITDL